MKSSKPHQQQVATDPIQHCAEKVRRLWKHSLLVLCCALFQASCDGDLVLVAPEKPPGPKPATASSLSPKIAPPGATLTLTGTGFEAGMELNLVAQGGETVTLEPTVVSATEATFVLPEGQTGLLYIQDLIKAGLQTPLEGLVEFAITRLQPGLPLILKSPGEVCSSQTYYDGTGAVQQGTLDCSVKTANLDPARILRGQTIGTVTGELDNCQRNGQIGCIASSEFRSTDRLQLVPNCSGDRVSDCYTTAAFPAANTVALSPNRITIGTPVAGVRGTLTDCTAGGQVGCISTAAFPSMDTSNLDGIVTLSPLNINQLLVGDTNQFTFWDENGNQQTATGDSDLLASNLKASREFFGVMGSVLVNRDDCTTAGDTSCRATGTIYGGPQCTTETQNNCFVGADSGLVAVDYSLVKPANIKRGLRIAGQDGLFPSSDHPLPRFQDDGATGTLQAGPNPIGLTPENVNDRMVSTDNFSYWSPSGQNYTASGSADLVAGNIRQGVEIFGVEGTNSPPDECSYGTEGDCNNDSLCRWSGGSCGIDPFNIRAGITVLGTAGSLKLSCRDLINDAFWNTTTINGANQAGLGDPLDTWDTVGYTTLDPSIGQTPSVTGWGPNNVCGAELWEDLTADGACDAATDNCLIRDNVTGLIWSESEPSDGTAADDSNDPLSTVIDRCGFLNFAGISEWRLPTQMELLQAHIHGISVVGYTSGAERPGGNSLLNNRQFLYRTNSEYHSATLDSTDPSRNFQIGLLTGGSSSASTSDGEDYVCVTTQ